MSTATEERKTSHHEQPVYLAYDPIKSRHFYCFRRRRRSADELAGTIIASVPAVLAPLGRYLVWPSGHGNGHVELKAAQAVSAAMAGEHGLSWDAKILLPARLESD